MTHTLDGRFSFFTPRGISTIRVGVAKKYRFWFWLVGAERYLGNEGARKAVARPTFVKEPVVPNNKIHHKGAPGDHDDEDLVNFEMVKFVGVQDGCC